MWPAGLMAQNGLPPNAGARGAALGSTSVAFQDINSAFSNPAGLATLPSWGVTALGEQRFLLPEIRSVAAAGAVASRAGTFGIHLHYFGLEAYNEQRLGLLYARRLFENLYMGVALDLLNTRIPDFGSQLDLTGSIGLQAQVAGPLWLGVHLFNPFRIQRNNGEYYPTLLKAGFSYEASAKLLLTGEAEKDIDFPLRWKGGVEYQYIDLLAFRVGFSTQPVQATMGAGLSWENGLRMDFAFQWHQLLGWTPAFSVTFQVP
ncbi:MAG: hypothetical protein IPJ40_08840 [Saprospirales bacterium]|nr:hypothetical protein [Saprospirales bacterium]